MPCDETSSRGKRRGAEGPSGWGALSEAAEAHAAFVLNINAHPKTRDSERMP